MASRYTLLVFTENSPGVLQRITVLFTKRKMNIESLTVSETETAGTSRFTIVVKAERDLVEKVARQIMRVIEVSDVSLCGDDELIFKEIAFIKVTAKDHKARREIEEVAHRYGAHIVFSKEGYLVVEKTGSEDEVNSLTSLLEPYGITQFVRSGRIAIAKEEKSEKQPVDRNERLESASFS
jgi:acetolactate synthase-1/3 small subunit